MTIDDAAMPASPWARACASLAVLGAIATGAVGSPVWLTALAAALATAAAWRVRWPILRGPAGVGATDGSGTPARAAIPAPGQRRIGRLIALAWLHLVGAVFLVSALAKLADFAGFTGVIAGLHLAPTAAASPLAAAVIAAEALIALSSQVPRTRRFGAAAAIAALVAFAIVIWSSVGHGLDAECGCFGASSGATALSGWLAVRDLALAASVAAALGWADPDPARRGIAQIGALIVRHRIAFPAAALLAVLFATIVPVVQSDRLRAERSAADAPEPDRRAAGGTITYRRIAAPEATGAAGDRLVFAASERTRLLVFSPTCPHCLAAIPGWCRQYQDPSSGGDGIRTVGIGLSAKLEPGFLADHGIRFPVYVPDDLRAFRQAYRITGVPTVLLVDGDGAVVAVEAGGRRGEASSRRSP